jgi:hypothetical protein
MLLLLVLHCFDLFVDSIYNVALEKEVANLWHIKESKANVSIQSIQGMQPKKIGMNFSMCLFHAPT